MIDRDEVGDNKYHHIKAPRMSFLEALPLISTGKRLARDVWSEIDFIFLVGGSEFSVSCPPLDEQFEHGTKIGYKQHIDSMYCDGTIGVWTLSQCDVFATDWYVK